MFWDWKSSVIQRHKLHVNPECELYFQWKYNELSVFFRDLHTANLKLIIPLNEEEN